MGNLKIRERRYLPHWEVEGATYAVTFRLRDSLPQAVLAAYVREREGILEIAEELGRPLTEQEQERLEALYSERIEAALDQGLGACWLRHAEVGQMVFDAIRYFHPVRYELFTWCVMPNHVHVLFSPKGPHVLKEILQSWKSFTAKEANRILGRKGNFWMAECYDHLVRDEQDFWRQHRYIVQNPGRAGLMEWKWVETTLGKQRQ